MQLSDRCCVLCAAVWCVLLCLARVLLTTGNYENSPFDHGPRYLAIYANHSTQPNAKFESVKVRKPGPLGLKYRMLLVSTEPIEAGCEIRVNYDAGVGRDLYWKVRAKRSRRRSFLTSTHLANLLSLSLSLSRTGRPARRDELAECPRPASAPFRCRSSAKRRQRDDTER